MGGAEIFPEPKNALYLPNGYAARQMEIGDEWQTLNLGVMFRQNRPGAWSSAGSISATVAFGLCSGTAKPYGSAEPHYFVGVRTETTWTRVAGVNWWAVDWTLFSTARGDEFTPAQGSGATIRVSAREESLSSAWYLRFRKSGGTLTVEIFVPESLSSPTIYDLETQLDRERWQANVNNHEGYRQYAADLPLGPDTLDCVNILSDAPNFVTSELRAIEWLAVKAVRLE